MKKVLLVILLSCTCLAAMAAEWRCGWLENPTPANQWLIDRDGAWTISLQGAYFPDYTKDI
ncbi:MAG: DUF4087 domain-containing protein, partial [Saezia sp.]